MISNDVLLDQLETNKYRLLALVERLENVAEDIDNMIPKKYDYKTRYIMVDRVQVLTQLFDSILKYRSEISKQIREQINISNKFNQENDPEEIRDSIVRLPIDQLKNLLKD